MELILWRHAEAVDGVPDHDRELTARGLKQAEKVAAFLQRQLPDPPRILVSPATRTQQTAKAFTKRFTTSPAVAAGASVRDILEAAHWPKAGGTVLVVGHQPDLGEVAAHLLGCDGRSLSMKKGALWWFSRRERDGSAETTLRLVISPDFL